VIERARISGRAKARRLAAKTLTATLTADQIKMIEALLVVDPGTKRLSRGCATSEQARRPTTCSG
jgi:hypothetical protein